MAGKGNSVRTVYYALGANFSIFVAKGFAAFITGSGAMLAEAVHSLADCGNQVLLLLGMKRARRPATPDYPLGYGKEIYFWSFLVALMLFYGRGRALRALATGPGSGTSPSSAAVTRRPSRGRSPAPII